jgi:ribosomal protein S8
VELVDVEELSKEITISGNTSVGPNVLTESDVEGLTKTLDKYMSSKYTYKNHDNIISNEENNIIAEIVNRSFSYNNLPDDIFSSLSKFEETQMFTEDANIGFGEDLEKLEKEAVEVLDKKNLKEISKIKKQTYNFDKILLRVVKPHDIVILETRYGTRLGYLEINKSKQGIYNNVSQGLSQVVGRLLSSKSNENDSNLHKDNLIKRIISFIVDKVSDNIKMDLMKVSGKEKNILVDKAIQNISPQLYDVLKRMIIEQKLGTNNYDLNAVNTRFIPVNRMIHFKSPGAHGSPPYSSSILDPLILPGKLYILSQLANVMTKLSRAAVVRKWKIETGASNMHASMIQVRS